VNFRNAALGLVGAVLAACAGNVGDKSTGSEGTVGAISEDIVRGQVEKHFPQVVAVYVGGFNGSTLCSGTYIASRVVVTAAHCMRADAIPDQNFVYFGKDYNTDKATLPNIPPPGSRSNFARVESNVVNPNYDAGVNYPDMAILFLDRELPFEPIALDRQHVSDRTDMGKIVGWGGELALTPDITQVEGAGIKRSANALIVGSPTADDYHADDPNPGMLDPNIRANLLKIDGRAPHANTCAGDSGGPLLVERHGDEVLAGVGFWTGLSCEDYAIFTRIDPFLAYFDAQTARSGNSTVTPRLECVESEANGKLKAHFGYTNQNGVTVHIPYGPHNSLTNDTHNVRPDDFAPGDDAYLFSVEFSKRDSLKWKLDPPHGKSTTVRVDASSPACDPNDIGLLCGDACNNELAAACADPNAPRSRCMSDCTSNADFFDPSGCGSQYRDYVRCTAAVPSAAENWDCSLPGIAPSPLSPNCDDELNGLITCLYY
jgi:secreted trypsin-like serine protease